MSKQEEIQRLSESNKRLRLSFVRLFLMTDDEFKNLKEKVDKNLSNAISEMKKKYIEDIESANKILNTKIEYSDENFLNHIKENLDMLYYKIL